MDRKPIPSFRNSLSAKIALIIVISLLLLIPAAQIKSLVIERQSFGAIAREEVTKKWARNQVTGAVVLSAPATYQVAQEDDEGRTKFTETKTTIHFLPQHLNIQADAKNSVRYRGIYPVPLYEAQITMTGNFSNARATAFDIKHLIIHWDQARLELGVSDLTGVQNIEVKWNDNELPTEAGPMLSNIMQSGIIAEIPGSDLAKMGEGQFHVRLGLRGSEALEFFPFGNATHVNLTSDWGSPSFSGAFLPEEREVSGESFEAQWKILGVTRNLPRQWLGDLWSTADIDRTRFGVEFLMPLQNYQLNIRSLKYALLYIALTFITMFLIETLSGPRFHPLHYTMTGAGLVLFYLLLLSFSEHISFGAAYLIATVATVTTISLYVLGISKKKKSAGTVFAQLGLLYGFLFMLLKQESFALVLGASGLWFVLVVAMYITRKTDWFHLAEKPSTEGSK